MADLEEKLEEYADTFNDNFPLFYFMGKDDAEVIDSIDTCLQTGKPLKPDDVDGFV